MKKQKENIEAGDNQVIEKHKFIEEKDVPIFIIRNDLNGYLAFRTNYTKWTPVPKELRDEFASTLYKLRNQKWNEKCSTSSYAIHDALKIMRGNVKTSVSQGDSYFEPDWDTKSKEREKAKMEKKWLPIEGLYHQDITIDNYRGFKNVRMNIFRFGYENPPPFNPRDFIADDIPDFSSEYENRYEVLKECFTLDEIQQIRDYLGKRKGVTLHEPCVARLPESKYITPGYYALIGWGGGADCYIFSWDDDYPLDFVIAGHCWLW